MHHSQAFTTDIIAISSALMNTLPADVENVRIIGNFTRAMNVLVGDKLVALVLPELCKGPFHIVVKELPVIHDQPSFTFHKSENVIELGDWAFIFQESTQYWNPMPDWQQVTRSRLHTGDFSAAVEHALTQNGLNKAYRTYFFQQYLPPPLAEKIKSSIHNRTKQDIANAVQSIVGKGPGLTPSGDDFLAGMMLSLWTMSDPAAHTVCRIILDSARKMTTDISLAYLRAIASGYTDERWHNLLYALAANNSRLLDSAIRHILAFGATSGSDMLIGFVWGLQQLNFHKL